MPTFLEKDHYYYYYFFKYLKLQPQQHHENYQMITIVQQGGETHLFLVTVPLVRKLSLCFLGDPHLLIYVEQTYACVFFTHSQHPVAAAQAPESKSNSLSTCIA